MGFFDKLFRTKVTADITAAEPLEEDFSTALSMHLRGEIEPALNAYLKYYEEHPDDTLALFFASTIKAGKGNIGEAAESLRFLSRRISLEGQTLSLVVTQNVVALMSSETHSTVPAVAEIIVSFGDLLKKEGFVQESVVCFEIAAGLVPAHANVLHKLGDTLHDLRIYDYAESVLLEALKHAPNHWGALYTYAVLLQDLGRIEEAVTYYEKAVTLIPNHIKCQNNLGAALMMSNRLEEALAHCSLAEKLDPASPLVKINLGNIYSQMREYENARRCFTEAISLDKNFALAYFGLGLVEQSLGSENELIRDLFLKAIELNPSIPEFHHALSKLLAGDGNPEDQHKGHEVAFTSISG
ncbi:MAG: tetratricopeptide repeat protein [Desulfuromonadaceae bacterium]|nr:tetratricopeptide repeat protein [Desulfuromonadaceae bacterium]MDD5107155.1 tetratricopeptide repeat protein [Desulfuromonadaceae bacterium]